MDDRACFMFRERVRPVPVSTNPVGPVIAPVSQGGLDPQGSPPTDPGSLMHKKTVSTFPPVITDLARGSSQGSGTLRGVLEIEALLPRWDLSHRSAEFGKHRR